MPLYSDVNYLNKTKGSVLTDVEAVYQAIYTLLGTKVGQRVFRPTYGSYLDNYLFEPCDQTTADKILADITTTLSQEPRVQLNLAKSSVIPRPVDKMFSITLIFNILGFGETEKSLQLTLRNA